MFKIANLSTEILDDQQQYKQIINNISFDIEAGEVFALIGESGSGKTMTALSIMRLLPNTARFFNNSEIILHGKNLLNLPEKTMRTIRGADIGMIFQDPMTSLNPVLTIGSQIAEVLRIHRQLVGRQSYIEVLRLLDAMRIPDAVRRYNSYPHELSGGMKQRVMIAMALACKPSLLIADEPTTALDVTTQAQILKLLQEIQRQENMAMLLITHNLAVAAQLADHIAVMQNGRIVEQNTREKFFNSPQHAYSRKLLTSLPALIDLPNHDLQQESKVLLQVQDLKVYFPIKQGLFRRTTGYVQAVDGVSFELNAGETLALVGESGSGKTTVAKAILGLYKEASGTIEYAGQNLLDFKSKQIRSLRNDIQIIFQDPYSALDPKLRINESLAEGLIAQGKFKTSKDCSALLDELLVQVGLNPEFKMRFPHELSGGERQRVCIARALTVEPKIIVCDEPTSSLDVSIQAQIINLLHSLQTAKNLTYLFISHDLMLVNLLAHKVAVMYKGKIVEYGPVQAVLTNPQHEYTKQLMTANLKIERES